MLPSPVIKRLWLHSCWLPCAEAPEEGAFVSGQRGPELGRGPLQLSPEMPAAPLTPPPRFLTHRNCEMLNATFGVPCYAAVAD